MRILLDECRFAGFKGLENGALLGAAERAGFEVMITADQNMPLQQDLVGRKIAVVVLRAQSTNRRHLRALVPEVLGALETLTPGQLIRMSSH
jgi:predicted nuclease of predicted toxin-antitoxin system